MYEIVYNFFTNQDYGDAFCVLLKCQNKLNDVNFLHI